MQCANNRSGKTLYAVVPHAESKNQTGQGVVVRTASEGRVLDFHNYAGVPIIAMFARKSSAQKYADKLNA